MNELALCSGIGGISLGLRLALGVEHRTVCHVERDAYAAAVLVARMEDQALDQAPIWDSLETFDCRLWSGGIDIVTAGYPCQPHSVAGKRQGKDDERNLWPEVARIISEVKPRFAFLENVPGAMRFTYDEVIPDLRSMGYRVEAGLFSAEEVGAQHKRLRLFALAYPDEQGLEGALNKGRREYMYRVEISDGRSWCAEPEVFRSSNGVPVPMDGIRALGNAVVPVVAAKAFLYLAERMK